MIRLYTPLGLLLPLCLCAAETPGVSKLAPGSADLLIGPSSEPGMVDELSEAGPASGPFSWSFANFEPPWAETPAAIPAAASLSPGNELRLDVRLRHEGAHQEGGAHGDASWTSLRAGLHWTGRPWQGLEVDVGLGLVERLGAAHGDAGDEGDPSRLAIADPSTRGVDRLSLSWLPGPDWRLSLGRQVLEDGRDGRWLGSDPWRQTPQVFDAISLAWQPDQRDLLLAAVMGMRRSDGQRVAVDAGVLLVQQELGSWRLNGLAQFVDFDRADQGVDQWTLGGGLEWTTTARERSDLVLGGRVEAALQQGWRDAPRYSTLFLDLRLWAEWQGWRISGGHVWLGSDDRTQAFQTPFASHADQQGWAVDDTVIVPERGLRDLHIEMAWAATPSGLLIEAAFHDYFDHDGSLWQGKEYNLGVAWQSRHWQAGLRYAYAISPFWRPDTHRGWAWLGLVY